jgi:hypothetical protein
MTNDEGILNDEDRSRSAASSGDCEGPASTATIERRNARSTFGAGALDPPLTADSIRLALKSESLLDVIVVTTRQGNRTKGILYGKRTEMGKIGAGAAGW